MFTIVTFFRRTDKACKVPYYQIEDERGKVLPCGLGNGHKTLFCTSSRDKAEIALQEYVAGRYKGYDWLEAEHYAKKQGLAKSKHGFQRKVTSPQRKHSAMQENLRIARSWGLEYDGKPVIHIEKMTERIEE